VSYILLVKKALGVKFSGIIENVSMFA